MPANKLPSASRPRARALDRLGLFSGRARVPFVQQLTPSDCGAACLAMVLAHYGRHVDQEQIREALACGRDGASAFGILVAARSFGLHGRGIKAEVRDLARLPRATILFWNFGHFVVLERAVRDGVWIVDPDTGRRLCPWSEVDTSFTGVALTFVVGPEFTRGPRPPRRYGRYVRWILRGREQLRPVIVTSLLLQLLALALPTFTASIVDRVIPRSDHLLLLVLCLGGVSLVAFHFLSSMVRSHLLLQLRTVVDAEMGVGFLQHLTSLPYAFLQRRSAGDLMMRIGSNTQIRELLTSSALSAILDGAFVFVYGLLLLFASPTMFLLALGLAACEGVLFLLILARQAPLIPKEVAAQAKLQGQQIELLSGLETLKSMGVEGRAVEAWSSLYVDLLNVSLERGGMRASYDAIHDALRLAVPLILLAAGTHAVLSGTLTLGTMFGVNALCVGVLTPLSGLFATGVQLQVLGNHVERVDDILDAEPEEDKARPRRPIRLAGAVTLERVSFRYSAQSAPVVDDVSFHIRAGQFVAFVGRSGSGKSSLARLLVGLYRPSSGRLAFDGIDLADIDLAVLRSQIGIVTQRPHLMGATLKHNIALADPMTPTTLVVAAAKLAGIHADIEAMPLGYLTPLVDGGASLSGGQRQRIALARALLRNPSLLILDEATSALDAISEAKIQSELATLSCTRIVIAHRLSTVRDADVIYVMDAGRIVEAGRHEELLTKRGLYRALWTAQVGTGPRPWRSGEPTLTGYSVMEDAT